MKTDARIKAILSEINCGSLVDIGCDHGKVIASALKTGKTTTALGVDISEKSLQKARELCALEGVAAEFLVADGKDVRLCNFDVAVIAGLGGIEIVEILNNNKQFPKQLVLVPHQDPMVLRTYLNKVGLHAKKDYVVQSGKHFYDIIVTGGSAPYTAFELYFGKNTPPSEMYRKRLLTRLAAVDEILKKNPKVSVQMQQEREVLVQCLS